jgi:hypothetical protein
VSVVTTVVVVVVTVSCRQLGLEGPGVSQTERWALKKDLARKKADRTRAPPPTRTRATEGPDPWLGGGTSLRGGSVRAYSAELVGSGRQ